MQCWTVTCCWKSCFFTVPVTITRYFEKEVTVTEKETLTVCYIMNISKDTLCVTSNVMKSNQKTYFLYNVIFLCWTSRLPDYCAFEITNVFLMIVELVL